MNVLMKFVLILVMNSAVTAQVIQACFSVNGIPNTASKAITICPGNFELRQNNCSATPGDASYIQYAWENITTSQSFSEGPSHINSVGTAGVWVGTMHYNDGIMDMISRDTVAVTFYTLPTLSLTLTGTSGGKFDYTPTPPNAVKCLISTGTFNVFPNNLVSYEWFCNNVNPNTPLSTSTSFFMNEDNSFHSPYRVEAMDNNGCKSIFTFGIGISSPPPILLTPQSIEQCANVTSTIILKDTNRIGTFAWFHGNPPNDLLTADQNNSENINTIYLVKDGIDLVAPLDTFDLPESTTYYMYRYTTFFCPAQDTILFTVFAPPVANAGLDTSICYGTNATLRGKVLSGGTRPFVYTWSNGATDSVTTVSPNDNSNYYLSVTDASGCSFTPTPDTVTVDVNPQIILTASNDTAICRYPAGTANLLANATGGNGLKSYSWLPIQDLSDASIANPTATPVVNRTYTVTAIDAANCSISESVTITSYTPAIGAINDPAMVSEGEPFVYDVGVPANSGFSFVWTDLSTMLVVSNSSDFEAKFQGTQDTIEYQIVVTDPSNGCTVTDIATVRYISNNKILYVPNIFSPGAEYEDNQKLKVFADNISQNGFRFIIFNKWGQIVFETTEVADAREGWDGGPQIEGIYTYVMEGKFNNGTDLVENSEHKGFFKLSK